MLCGNVEVKIINAYYNEKDKLDFIPLDKKINNYLQKNKDKEFIDIRHIEKGKAIVIMNNSP